MAIATQGTASNYLQRAPSPSGLADVVELILDKGLVIDAYVRIDLTQTELAGLPELQEKGAEMETEGAIEGVKDKLTPDGSALGKAAKGAVAAAAVGAAAAAAREIAKRSSSDD